MKTQTFYVHRANQSAKEKKTCKNIIYFVLHTKLRIFQHFDN